MTRLCAIASALLIATTGPLTAQTVSTALEPDTITVGQTMRLAVRLNVSDGEVLFPDTLPVGEDIENLARVRVATADSAAPGTVTGVYTLTAWRPGPLLLETLRVPIRGEDGSTRTIAVDLPDAVVVSVLPPDTAGLEPRPAREVLGPNWVWWWWVVGSLVALALVALLVWWWRRRRARRAGELVPDVPARERALAALDEAWRSRPEHGRAPDPFYAQVSRLVRGYLDELDERWGLDRTTSELSAALLAHLSADEAARLRDLLKEADAVKFARAWPEVEEAERFWRSARDWVENFREPVDETVEDGGAEVEQ